MIQAASELLRIPLAETYMIGDRGSDLAAAGRAGCPGVFLDRLGNSHGEWPFEAGGNPVKSFPNLMEAVLTLSATWKM
jgi:phosphoglycolate phosphatase-like HAD superfamily hydrolase